MALRRELGAGGGSKTEKVFSASEHTGLLAVPLGLIASCSCSSLSGNSQLTLGTQLKRPLLGVSESSAPACHRLSCMGWCICPETLVALVLCAPSTPSQPAAGLAVRSRHSGRLEGGEVSWLWDPSCPPAALGRWLASPPCCGPLSRSKKAAFSPFGSNNFV